MPKGIDNHTHVEWRDGNASIDRSAFCWRPYWYSRFESLWSLLRKFAYLNAINHYEIRKLFKRDEVTHTLDWKWCLRADLRHFGGLDPSKLSVIFGIGDNDLAEATVLRYVQEYEAGTLTSEFLRFCPTCIYQGFHSPLHQLLFLTKCPAHGNRLEIRCPECISPTIPYKLPFVSSKDLSNCVHMQYGLSQHLIHARLKNIRKESIKRERSLFSVARWLIKRVELNTPEQPIAQWMPQRASQKYFMRHLRRLPAYWVNVFGDSSCKAPPSISKVSDTHIQINHRIRKSFSRFDSKASLPRKALETWDIELYRIYKAIGRYLVRNYLRQHRRCIVRGGKHVRWGKHVLTWQGIICPAINALLLWKMYWEGLDHPSLLFRAHKGPYDYPRPRIYWDPPSENLPDWALRRIFTLECIGLFHECLLLSELFYRRNTYSLHSGFIRGRRKPHWLIQKNEDGVFTIHWWVLRSLSSLFSHSSSHFKSREAKTCSKNSFD
jgi:hypothetical protein